MQSTNCPNCGGPLPAGDRFCANCGQKAALHRLSLKEVTHETLHFITHVDKGILTLLSLLVRRPGLVPREYIAGRRRTYFPPINFFLLVAAIYVFMLNAVAPMTRQDAVPPAEIQRYEHIKDPVQKARVAAILERRYEAVHFISKYANIVAMIATPLISFFMWLFYRRGRYNYTEHLVANMYISGFTVLSYALLFGPVVRLMHLGGMNPVLIAFFLFELVYRSVSYYYFMDKHGTAAAVKSTLANGTVILIWFVFVITVVYLYISNGFFGLAS